VLPTIVGYCVRVRVKLGSRILDSYSHWMPSMGRITAKGMDTKPWGRDTAYRRVRSLAGNVRDPIQGFRGSEAFIT
jgi:hypothetical protein